MAPPQLRVMGYGLWVMGYGLWVMGYVIGGYGRACIVTL